MGRLPPLALIAGLALLAVTTRAAPDDDASDTRRFESGDKGVSVELPKAWRVARPEFPGSIMALQLKSDDVDGYFALFVFQSPAMRNERGQAWAERIPQQRQFKADAPGEVRFGPLTHLLMDVKENGEVMTHVWMFRILGRTGITLHFTCRATSWPSIKDAAFRAAATMTSTLDENPPRPDGYKPLLRDGYEYLLHPSLKDKDIDVLHAAVLEQEKRYGVLHGAVPKPEGNPIVVVVTPDKATAAALSPDGSSKFGFAASWREGRVFAVPLKKDDALGRAELADRLALVFHVQCCGDGLPLWLSDGERRVAAAEAFTRKPLPSVATDYVAEFATSLVTLDQLATKPPKDAVAQSASYVALFRAGPQAYRDAFKSFLLDLAATGDWETSQRTHILSLDQEKLRSAAQTFVAKELKPVKVK
jgi:hypothetical protein